MCVCVCVCMCVYACMCMQYYMYMQYVYVRIPARTGVKHTQHLMFSVQSSPGPEVVFVLLFGHSSSGLLFLQLGDIHNNITKKALQKKRGGRNDHEDQISHSLQRVCCRCSTQAITEKVSDTCRHDCGGGRQLGFAQTHLPITHSHTTTMPDTLPKGTTGPMTSYRQL